MIGSFKGLDTVIIILMVFAALGVGYIMYDTYHYFKEYTEKNNISVISIGGK